ncbi:MAG: alpha/beta fold hydrolase [Myxococcota bacterium]|nr:alpha/beta fold hydrolase [Myxococcota bacterium]
MPNIYHLLRNQLGSIRKVYLRGNKISRKEDFGLFPETVLLLHGFFQTRNIWEIMERRLRREGFGVLSLNLGGLLWQYNTKSITKQAEFLYAKMEKVCKNHNIQKFHIIGHSMGGLIARHYIQSHGGHRRVKSLITLGSPHHGTPTALIGVFLMGAGVLSVSPFQMLPNSRFVKNLRKERFPVDIPLTSIFSRHDVICPWWASVLRPDDTHRYMKNYQLRGIGHSELTHQPQVFQLVLDRLNMACKL